MGGKVETILPDRVRTQSYQGSLTALPNRELFKARVDQALSTARHRNYQLAVLFIGLGDFKHVNETFGHAVGDLLLQEVGQQLE